MAQEPAMSGAVPADGMLEVLRQIEAGRISGRLRFTVEREGRAETGEVELVAGQLALTQPALPDGTDPVERLLVLREGHYVVHQRLPALPVSQGDEQHRRGSLAVHAPSDLMGYCERAGLTGTLRLTQDGSLVEMVYEAGDLLGIRVDGEESADLSRVFSWEDGRFEIGVGRDVHALVPDDEPEDPSDREPTTVFVRSRPNETGRHFLRVVEVALADIVERREKAQHKGKGQTSVAPAPDVRPRVPSEVPPPRRPRGDGTVRVVILGPEEAAPAPRAPEPPRPGSAPGRKDEPMSEQSPPKPPTAPTAAPPQADSPAGTAGWVFAVLALGVVILGALARFTP